MKDILTREDNNDEGDGDKVTDFCFLGFSELYRCCSDLDGNLFALELSCPDIVDGLEISESIRSSSKLNRLLRGSFRIFAESSQPTAYIAALVLEFHMVKSNSKEGAKWAFQSLCIWHVQNRIKSLGKLHYWWNALALGQAQ